MRLRITSPKFIKQRVLATPWLRTAWTRHRRSILHRNYVERRERYESLATKRGEIYIERAVVAKIRERLALRGHTPVLHRAGEVHTFAFIPRVGWHPALFGDLRELGVVTEFDPIRAGYSWDELYVLDRRFPERRRAINKMVLQQVLEAHARHALDWVFVYASGWEILADTVREIIDETGIPVVCMCLDDKQSWTGPVVDGQHFGQVDIAPAFDLCWTSARVACVWYLVEGALPVYMPEGFDTHTFKPLPVEQDIPVSFIGGGYGYRPDVIRFLRKYGVSIQTFGSEWGNRTVPVQEQVEIINRSIVNLGMGGIGYHEMLTSVKGRDFEIPGTGGGVYLTSFNPDLAQHFVVGDEILCYRNREEMLELIRHYLRHRDAARAIALRGRERCLLEHRWLHRYEKICRILGILPDDAEPGAAGGAATTVDRST